MYINHRQPYGRKQNAARRLMYAGDVSERNSSTGRAGDVSGSDSTKIISVAFDDNDAATRRVHVYHYRTYARRAIKNRFFPNQNGKPPRREFDNRNWRGGAGIVFVNPVITGTEERPLTLYTVLNTRGSQGEGFVILGPGRVVYVWLRYRPLGATHRQGKRATIMRRRTE